MLIQTNCRLSSLLGDDGVELFKREVVVGLGVVHDVGVVHHLSKLLIVKSLAELAGDALEAIEVGEALGIFVPDLEHTSQTIAGFGVTNLLADNLQELLKINGPFHGAQSVNYLEDNLAPTLKAQLL